MRTIKREKFDNGRNTMSLPAQCVRWEDLMHIRKIFFTSFLRTSLRRMSFTSTLKIPLRLFGWFYHTSRTEKHYFSITWASGEKVPQYRFYALRGMASYPAGNPEPANDTSVLALLCKSGTISMKYPKVCLDRNVLKLIVLKLKAPNCYSWFHEISDQISFQWFFVL